MECDKCREEMTAFLDGELSPLSDQEMKAHLAACRKCAVELEEMKESFAFVESHMVAAELRPEVWQQVRSRVATIAPPEPAGALQELFQKYRWVTATAALMVTSALAFGFWGYLRYEQSSRELQKYMNTYIEQREALRPPEIPVLDASSPQHVKTNPVAVPTDFPGDRNPFVEVDSTLYSNPFRTEAQR
jgi:anti-sigma factor RsiW